MAMRIPKPTGGDLSPRSLPNVRVGNMADPSHFGADNWRDIGRLGRAVQGLGHSFIDEAQRRQRDEDETFSRNKTIEARTAIEDQKRILQKQYQGQDSVKYAEELEKLTRQVRERVGGGLRNDHQRKAFDRAMDAYGGQLRMQAIAYRDGQMEIARNNSLMAMNEMVVEAAATGEEDEDVAIRILHDNADALNRGQSVEVRDLARRQAERILFGKRAEFLAASSPGEALAYLDSDRVRKAFPAAELRKLRENYKTLSDNANLYAQAQGIVGEAGTSSTRIMEEAAKLHPDDGKKFNDLVRLADNLNSRIVADARNAKIAERQAVWDEWGKNGYDPRKMPEAVMNDPDNWEKAVRFAEFMGKVDFEATVPNFTELDRLHGMAPDELRDWLSDSGNYLQLQGWAAGRKDELDRVVKKSRGEATGARAGDGSGGFKFDDKITKNILRNSVDLTGGWFGSETEMSDAVNAVHDLFQMRMREEKNKDAKPEDVYYDLMREVKANPELLRKSSLDFRQASADMASDAPRVETVDSETGRTDVSIRDPDTGNVRTFEKLTGMELRDFPEDTRGGMRVPADAEPGQYRGLSYEPGDIILDVRDRRPGSPEATVIYGPDFHVKAGSGGGRPARRGEADLPPEPRPEPPKTPIMRNWEKENDAEFVWQPRLGYFTAEAKDPNNPSGTVQYTTDGPGSVIAPAFGGATTDADLWREPGPAPEPPRAVEIREKLERLRKEVSSMERDPRTRKDVEAGKRGEIERLEAEYERVTGKNVKESRFYVP